MGSRDVSLMVTCHVGIAGLPGMTTRWRSEVNVLWPECQGITHLQRRMGQPPIFAPLFLKGNGSHW
jgi:hypothetical protein